MGFLLLAVITSFVVVLLSTPSVIRVAFLKRLFDEPGEARKLHKRVTPTIGGIMIFAGTILAVSLWFPWGHDNPEQLQSWVREFQIIVASSLILFFVGIKDDIIGTAPIKKLGAQIIVALMLVLMAEIRLRSLHGLFGVQEIPLWASIFLSLFTIIVVTNSFNLIDGVDGLASGVGLIGAVCFGVLFYLGGDLMMSILAFALAGSLAAFLVFNFAPAKIFMGDSGSLTIGLFMSILAIRYVEFKPAASSPEWLAYTTNPVVVMSLLAYALTDTLRIFIYRAMKGLSPFSADRNHLHHLLVDSGFSHAKAVISIYISMCIVIGVAVLTGPLENTLGFAITGGTVVVFIFIPVLIKRRYIKKNGNQSKTRRLDPMEAA